MLSKRKICVVTGSRAEYGLLYWLMKGIEKAEDLELQILVTGMHLSPEFGRTYRDIENDGFVLTRKVEMLVSSDTSVGIAKSMALGLAGITDAFEELQPDIVVMLGDRFELLAAASAALVATLPIAHLHGGETTEGAFDEAIRHSITKMAHLHFTATEEYRRRVIQLGEHPNRVFNVGGLGIDSINNLPLLTRKELEKRIGLELGERNLMVTFHPATLDTGATKDQFQELLTALDQLDNTHLLFTKANADTEGLLINEMIDEYVVARPQKTVAHTSLGQLAYLSALKQVDGIVGNSSSGITEGPSFRIGTVNIGDRQKGRIRAKSIIDCQPKCSSIVSALSRMFSQEFKEILATVTNPYGTGGAAEVILKHLRTTSLEGLVKKSFFDLSF